MVSGTIAPAAREDGRNWWLTGIEGLVAIIIGLFIVVQPVDAAELIRQLIALVLLALSLKQILDGFRRRERAIAPWASLRGGVGTTFALLALLTPATGDIPVDGARQLLAIGLIVYGVLGIVATLVTVRSGGFDIAAIVADALAIVFGILMLGTPVEEVGRIRFLGWAALLAGIILLVYAYILWSRTRAPA